MQDSLKKNGNKTVFPQFEDVYFQINTPVGVDPEYKLK